MMFAKIAFLVNQKAGKKNISHFISWATNQLDSQKIDFQLFNDNWPSSLDTFTDVWVVGGDGTINYFINKYPHCLIPIVLFKGGTGNDFATQLYGNLSNQEIFKKVIVTSPKYVDAGRFNNMLYLNCLGIGFDGEVLRAMTAIRFIGGHFGYLIAVLINIFSFREKRITIRSAKNYRNERFLLAMINNSPKAGGGFHIAPPAKIDDGVLDMVLISKLPIIKRLRFLPVIEKGKHLHLPFVIHERGHLFEINAEMLLPIQVDGELKFADSIKVTVLPRKFLFRY